ncbi:CobW family GTP-binding protein [Rhodococcoides corynebacterioides]|uniref:CobW family GTP-binding protein n=1 Tax=Rhodococcoides corynebacterioides TaxID=53972 RepID=UPI001C9B01BA|nr:CobW family GTP-binding protein [Rhodococcus corynebacterioides]MBY6362330.1 GTP-binding protein [Rhodococcus corynebacterioides]
MPGPVPVVLVAGYLGSGKTTMLNHVLRRNRGIRLGVIVNDFGSIDIDSMLVAGQVDSVIGLGNGCLCCAVDSEDLDEMLGTLTGPSSPVDAVVIEASGLAEPRALIRMVLGSSHAGVRYGGLVVVVDAVNMTDSVERHPDLAQHLAFADLVVVNKSDLVGDDGRASMVNLVRRHAPGAPVVITEHGRVDVALLLDPPERTEDDGPRQLSLDDLLREDDHDHDAHHEHLHDTYRSVAVETTRYVDPRALIALLEDPPAGLYRSKGFVRFTTGRGRFLLQTVGRHIVIERAPTRGSTALVFLGAGMDDDVDAAIQGVVRDRPATDEEMLVVHRYLREQGI